MSVALEAFLKHYDVSEKREVVTDVITSDSVEAFMAHYGVLGMHWGQRKKEPVSKEKQAKRDGRAQKFVKKAAAYDSAIKKLKAQPANNYFTKNAKKKNLKDLTEDRDKALKNAERKRNGKLSTTQRNLIIGGAVVGTIVAASAVSAGIESGDFNRLAQKGEAFLKGKNATDFVKNANLAKPDLTIDEIQNAVVKPINPNFGDIGTKMNCRRATMAYELRRRGNDVMATRTTDASGQTAIGLYNALNKADQERSTSNYATTLQMTKEMKNGFLDKSQPVTQMMKGSAGGAATAVLRKVTINPGGQTTEHESTAQALFRALATQPERSRGEVSAGWKLGGGHSMAYEIINGNVNIIDNQSGKIFKSLEEFEASDLPEMGDVGFTRLDDKHLNMNYLLKWVKNAE